MAVLVETYANYDASLPLAHTTLSGNGGSISAGATSIGVAAATGFPTTGQYRIKIETEVLLVIGGQGTTTWTVVRGVEGTTTASHNDGIAVDHLLTAGGLKGVCGSFILSDSFANLPSSSVIGRLYYPTDGYSPLFDAGTQWNPFGPGWPLVTPPALASWTQVNGTGATYSTQGGAINILANANANNDRKILARSAPSTPYSIIAVIAPDIYAQQFNNCGVGWRDSGTDHQAFINFLALGNSGPTVQGEIAIRSTNSTSSTQFHTAYVTFDGALVPQFIWFKIRDDGTNRIVSYSHDGLFFRQIHSIARTTDVANPNQVMFFAESINGTYQAAVTLLSWQVINA